jgi:hypothetical protein
LAPEDHDALVRDPPEDSGAFVHAILVAEGFDPILCDKQVKRWVTESVRDWIFDEGRGKGVGIRAPTSAARVANFTRRHVQRLR